MQNGLVSYTEKKAIVEGLAKSLKREPTQTEETQFTTLFQSVKGAAEDLTEDANAVTMTPERFLDVVNSYASGTRFFHTVEHLLEMTRGDASAYKQLAKAFSAKKGNGLSADELLRLEQVNTLAGFFHDQEYVPVDGDITHAGNELLKKDYIRKEGNDYYITDKAASDATMKLVLDTFGMNAGQQLSPFAGMNEVLSAMSGAIAMKEMGLSQKDILAVTASIEATVPFKPENRMEELRERVEKQLAAMGESNITREADMIIGNATLLANRDVIGLIGGLKPGDTITPDHLRGIMVGTDRMHQEEVPALRTSKPGQYPPAALLTATIKQWGLFGGLLADDSQSRILHGAKIKSAGTSYPPVDMLEKYESEGRKAAQYMSAAMKARIAALAVVTAVAKEKGLENSNIADLLMATNHIKSKDVHLAGSGQLPGTEHDTAYYLLSEPRKIGANDTPKATLASLLLRETGLKGIEAIIGTHPFKNNKVTDLRDGKDGAETAILSIAKKEAPETLAYVRSVIDKAKASPSKNWSKAVTTGDGFGTYVADTTARATR